ncbi:hypothetical protein ACFQ3W_01175 [Paenibacillus puldeungensis]|uniref:Uncharacterized protein n=1 Tax=Paenibacillus puldeungensis TaxID=696536 RepID=A0ABW3RR16_9BACL
MKYLRERLSSERVGVRIIVALILFFILFFGVMTISYYLLPEGLLKNKNPLQNWENSDNTLILTLQIFFYNQLSVLVILLGSLFAKKKDGEKNYLSIGYTAFFMFICINAIVLGTWSFSVTSEAVPLLGRFTRTFDLAHRAGLWEMLGQLVVTCAAAQIATVRTSGKTTVTRKFKDIHPSTGEKVAFLGGILLMLVGAVVESIAINSI